MEVKGSTALITGAASGIGLALSEACLERGARVIMADIEEDRLTSEAERLTSLGEVQAQILDVASPESWAGLCKAIEGWDVDVLVNNAGVGTVGPPAWELTLNDWRWIIDVNLWGAVQGLTAFLPSMIERDRGHVVTVSSAAGLLTPRGMAPYVATKHALLALSESLHHELAYTGSAVGVTAVCPGLVATHMADNERNRPPSCRNDADTEERRATLYGNDREQMRRAVAGARPPGELATTILDAVESCAFMVVIDDWILDAFRQRAQRIVDRAAPIDPS